MVYKFLVGSEEVDNFKLEIMIDSEDTFMRLRNTILEAVGYDKDQIDSFHICDDEWNKEKEVMVIDMDVDSDDDIWLMDDTHLDELLEDEGQRMKFMFDIMNERYFFMRLKETIPGRSLHDPLCTRKEGKAPKQVNIPDEIVATPKVEKPNIEAIEEDFYGEDAYHEDELTDLDAFEGENID